MAELHAVLQLCRRLWRPTLVLIDCRVVNGGMQQILQGGPPPGGMHAALWAEVRRIYSLAILPRGRWLRTRWVPSHVNEDRMNDAYGADFPEITDVERALNAGADAAALRGAAQHQAPRPLAARALRRLHITVAYQHLMARILDARRCAVPDPARQHESYAASRPVRCAPEGAAHLTFDWVQRMLSEPLLDPDDESARDAPDDGSAAAAVDLAASEAQPYFDDVDDDDDDPFGHGFAIG